MSQKAKDYLAIILFSALTMILIRITMNLLSTYLWR